MGESSLWGVILGAECDAAQEVWWGWVVYPFIMLYSFYILAKICDGHLTTALEFIVDRIQISEDVAGATFLAMASSAPELFTSIISTFVVLSATGVANIVGSAVFNLLVIIGVVPIFAGKDFLRIWWYPTARDACFYTLSIVELGIVLSDGKVYWYEGLIMLLSYVSYVVYFTQNSKICDHFGLKPPGQEGDEASEAGGAKTPEQEDPAQKDEEKGVAGAEAKLRRGDTGGTSGSADARGDTKVTNEDSPKKTDTKQKGSKGWSSGGSRNSDSSSESLEKIQDSVRANSRTSNSFSLRGAQKTQELKMSKVVPMPEDNPTPTSVKGPAPEVTGMEEGQELAEDGQAEEEEEEDKGWCKYEPIMFVIDRTMPNRPERLYSLFGLCCFWIGIFTYFAVDTGGRLGKCLINTPDVVMGLVVFAAGTSVPDAMGSIAVAKDGMGDLAVANAVGSNTFDILLGLGLPWFLKAAISGPIDVPGELLTEAIIILALCLAFYLVLLNVNKWILTKRLGFVLLLLYVVVIVFILVWHQVKYSD